MVSEVLSTGIDNAKSGRDLCQLLGICQRDLTAAVEKERRKGKPICASSNPEKPGYYLAADKEEMQRYCHSLFHRAGELHKTRRACLKTIEQLPDPKPAEDLTDQEAQ